MTDVLGTLDVNVNKKNVNLFEKTTWFEICSLECNVVKKNQMSRLLMIFF